MVKEHPPPGKTNGWPAALEPFDQVDDRGLGGLFDGSDLLASASP
jgi:hypothetical protein